MSDFCADSIPCSPSYTRAMFCGAKSVPKKDTDSVGKGNSADYGTDKEPGLKGKNKRGILVTTGSGLFAGAIALIAFKDLGRFKIYSQNLMKKGKEIAVRNPIISKFLKGSSNIIHALGDMTGKISDNMNSLKDTVCDRIIRVNDNKAGNKFVKVIKDFFKKLSISTMDSYYAKADAKMNDLIATVGKTGENGIGKRNKLNAGLDLLKDTINSVEKHFGKLKRMERTEYTERELQGFVEEVAGKIKTEKAGFVFSDKKLKPSIVTKKCNPIIEHINGEVKKGFEEVCEKLDKALKELEKVLSPEEMKIVNKKAETFKNTLSSANALEGEPMIRKLTEFSLGSATTDVLFTGVGALSIAGYQIFTADGKEEKYSKSLTQGIPVLGGLMTMFYGAAKMWAGPSAILAGIAAGKIFSVLGNIADKGRKSYAEKQSFIKVAIEAYNNSNFLNDKTEKSDETESTEKDTDKPKQTMPEEHTESEEPENDDNKEQTANAA